MFALPHDVSDLYLAPVVLAVEQRMEELGRLDVDALTHEVEVATNSAGWTRKMREVALLEAVAYLTDTHDWKLTWDPRGLRLTHGKRHIVLGTPTNFAAYLAGAPQAVAS